MVFMSLERTLCIIKPDGVRRNLVGQILGQITQADFNIKSLRQISLSQAQAKAFYAVHAERPFYGELCDSMTAGPVVVVALEGANAVSRYRDLMGATNPAQAAAGTLRANFALSIGENTVHGSDSAENAATEIAFFFSQSELL
jgi:nucleoside-diphosphate kinase